LDADGHKNFASKIIEYVYSFKIIITCDEFLYTFVATFGGVIKVGGIYTCK
jgi:hypothetical protein